MNSWKHIRAILILPVMATVVIPGVLLCFFGVDSLDLWQSAPITRFILPVIGAVLILLGLTLMVGTIRLFVTIAVD
jgi:sulfite exporter TauE/SafE